MLSLFFKWLCTYVHIYVYIYMYSLCFCIYIYIHAYTCHFVSKFLCFLMIFKSLKYQIVQWLKYLPSKWPTQLPSLAWHIVPKPCPPGVIPDYKDRNNLWVTLNGYLKPTKYTNKQQKISNDILISILSKLLFYVEGDAGVWFTHMIWSPDNENHWNSWHS